MDNENQKPLTSEPENAGAGQQQERGGLVEGPSIEQQIIDTKQLRKDIDGVIQNVRALPPGRETSLVITKLQEGLMWLGMNLKQLGNANPYPHSRDTSNTTVDPTDDGLKL